MTLLEQTERALINADAAGDTPSATVLAGEVRRLRELSAGEPSVETAPAPSGYVLPRLGQAVAAPFMGATAVAKGLANTGIGVAQLAAAGIGHGAPEAVDTVRTGLDRNYQKLRHAMGADQDFGLDAAEFIGGGIAGGKAANATARALPWLTTGGGIAQTAKAVPLGAAVAAESALVAPVDQPTEDFLGKKSGQVGNAMVFGTLAGPALPILQGVGRVGQAIARPFSERGRAEMLHEYRQKLLGGDPSTIQKVANALRQSESNIPGVKATASQVLANTPEATSLIAHEQQLASEMGTAPLFARRSADNLQARTEYLQPFSRNEGMVAGDTAIRDTVTGTMRNQALDAANAPRRAYGALASEVTAQDRIAAALMQQEGQLVKEGTAGWKKNVVANKDLAKLQLRAMRQAAKDLEKLQPDAPAVKPQSKKEQALALDRLQSQQEIAALASEKLSVPRPPLRTALELSLEARAAEGAAAGHAAGRALPAAQQQAEEAAFQSAKMQQTLEEMQPLVVTPIVKQVTTQLGDRTVQGSALAKKALESVKAALLKLGNDMGMVDAVTLDTFRGTTIKDLTEKAIEGSHRSPNTDAILLRALKPIRETLDTAIENAGGVGYKAYLTKFGTMSKDIEKFTAGDTLQRAMNEGVASGPSSVANKFKTALDTIKEQKSLPPTDLAKAQRVADELMAVANAEKLGQATSLSGSAPGKAKQIPRSLTQEGMVANYILEHFGKKAQAAIKVQAAQEMLNPKQLADELERVIQARKNVGGQILDFAGASRNVLPSAIGTSMAQPVSRP